MDIELFKNRLKTDYKQSGESSFNDYVIKRLYIKEVESVYEITAVEIYELLDYYIKWYHKFGSSASPDELLDTKDKIVTCSYWIGQNLDKLEKKYNLKKQYNSNEIERLYLQSSKKTNSHIARSTAKSSKSKDLMDEMQYKSDIKRLERLLSSLDKIVYAMQQRIAWLRQEANKTVEF